MNEVEPAMARKGPSLDVPKSLARLNWSCIVGNKTITTGGFRFQLLHEADGKEAAVLLLTGRAQHEIVIVPGKRLRAKNVP